MLRKLFLLAIAGAILGGIVFWIVTIPTTIPAGALASYAPNLANGQTTFNIGGCASCHAVPKQTDRTKLGGGRGLGSPFGTFYVPNISPDPKDGIGGWTEAQFVTAMVKGTSPAGEHYFPAFPYPSYQRMPANDLRDLFAYLKTLPAVSGRVRDHDVPFPFNVRRSLGGWKFLFLDGEPFKADPSQSPQWNRGAYLINGPGHCAECHSPRNIMGGIVSGKRFAGGPNPEGKGFIPNITQFRLKSWSVSDFSSVLETGLTPDGDSVGGSMAAVISNTSKLSEDDRKAMAVYLKSLPPVEGPRPPANK